LLLLFSLLGCGTLFGLLLLAGLALLLFAFFAFLLCGTFCCQSRLALFLDLALPLLLLSALGLETLLFFSTFTLAFRLALFLLCSPPPALLLFPRLFFFSQLSSCLSPCLLLFAFLLLSCFKSGLLLPKSGFLSGLFSCSLRTLFLLSLLLLPIRPDRSQEPSNKNEARRR
jgi:hypothetical protein